ncbi:MAG: RloB domain-containing protein [Pedobacter sp.]|jgi:hypothetical protein
MPERPLSPAIAVISEGDTESWYLNQLKTCERIDFKLFPKEGRNLKDMKKQNTSLIKDNSYDYIFCLVDMDTKQTGVEKQKLSELKTYIQAYPNIFLLESQPCFESGSIFIIRTFLPDTSNPGMVNYR